MSLLIFRVSTKHKVIDHNLLSEMKGKIRTDDDRIDIIFHQFHSFILFPDYFDYEN